VALYDPTIDGAPLALLTLPIIADQRPLPALQPALPDGIHLRWAFSRDLEDASKNLGFPWYGFYLFRRLTQGAGSAKICAASQFTGLTPGPRQSPDLSIGLGTIHSDQNLVLTDDFPAAGTVELDLSGRSFIQLQMNPALPNRNVDVTIGFVADFPPVPPSTSNPGSGGTGSSTSGLGAAGAGSSSCGCGCDHAAIAPFVDRVVAIGGGQYRATFGYENTGTVPVAMPVGPENRFFPDPPGRGQPTLLLAGRHSGAFSVIFNGRPLAWRLAGNTVTVSAADAAGGSGGTSGGSGGSGGTGTSDGIVVTALSNTGVVATRIVSGVAGQVVTVSLPFEAIDAVRVSSGPARLIDICATRNTDGVGQGWAPVPGLQQPVCLPVFDLQYPCNPGNPDENAARAIALGRIQYGDPAAWGGDVFHAIHQALSGIVGGGPGKGITDQKVTVVAQPDPSDPDATPPQIPDLSSLDLLLSGAINPAMAQLLGLYWVDATAVEGQSYDYMLVADYTNAGNHNVATIQALITAENFTNITAYRRVGVQHAVSPPLEPPQQPTAYSLPIGGVPANAPGDVAGQVGLRWLIRTMSDTNTHIRSDGAFLFHVWRKDLGRAFVFSTDKSPEFQRITDLPVSAGEGRTQAPDPVLAGWPNTSLFAVDGPLVEGWYAYRVSGIDIFGRYSDLSVSAPWVNAGAIREGDPNRAVHLMDTTPPPAPTGVQAWLLDPDDTFVIQDAAYSKWRTPSPPVAGRSRVTGLRVRWQWTGKQMRQAPDTKEFRIYVKGGSSLQQAALVTSWDRRIAAVGIGEQILSEVLAPVVTAAAVNMSGVSATAAGSVVTLADGDPLDAVNPQDGLELELPDATGGRTRFTVLQIDPNARTVTLAETPALTGVSRWNLGPAELRGQTATATNTVVTLTDGPPLDRLTIDALEIDLPAASGGRTRFSVIAIDAPNRALTLDAAPSLSGVSAWTLGVRERTYEVFLPGAPLAAPVDFVLPSTPSDQVPIAYAVVGVAAADDKNNERVSDVFAAQHSGASGLVPRTGNEGAVGGPMTIVQVLRTTPQQPTFIELQKTLSATRADFNSKSFFNLHFPRVADQFTQIYRALDETVFAVDRRKRFPTATPPNPPPPPTADSPSAVNASDLGWDVGRFNTAAGPITTLTSTGYDALLPDSLRLLASLPSNAEAFVCLNVTPLDPATPDAKRASDDTNYPTLPETGDPNASAYEDTLDGRASNKYFYRLAKVNRAHTAGKLGVSTPPVVLPRATLPDAPALVEAVVSAQDEMVTLGWRSSADPAVNAYRIYRATSADQVQRLLATDLVLTVPETRTPDLRPAVIERNDIPAPGGTRFFYAVTAVDKTGLESPPSRLAALVSFEDRHPAPPTWLAPQPQAGGLVLLSWSTSDTSLIRFLVQRAVSGTTAWTNLSGWLPADARSFVDDSRQTGTTYDYRLLVIDDRGRRNTNTNIVTA
jgi:hypothetical protein